MDTRRWECRCRIACAGTLDGMTGSKGYAETTRRPRGGGRPLCGGTAEEAHEAAASLSGDLPDGRLLLLCVGTGGEVVVVAAALLGEVPAGWRSARPVA